MAEEVKQQEAPKPTKDPWEMDFNTSSVPIPQKEPESNMKMAGRFLDPWEQDFSFRRPPMYAKAPPASSGSLNISSFISKLEKVESGGDPNAKASTSSATGLHQFTAGTWNSLVDKMGVDYTLADRKDPKKSREVVKFLTEQNAEKAQKDLGRPPSPVELYMYHFLGNAKRFLTAPLDGLAKDFVRPNQAKSNPSVFFDKEGKPKTVGEVLNRFRSKFE